MDAEMLRSSRDGAGVSTFTMSRLVGHKTVPHWNGVDYRRSFPNLLDARRFSAMVSHGRNSTMFNRLGVRRDTDIGV